MKNHETIKIKGRIRIITTDAKTWAVKRITRWMQNLVVSGTNTGRNLIAQRLGSTNTYTLNITHADIGTGATAPTNSDTALGVAVLRAVVTNQIISNNMATVQFFFPDASLPNGTYREFGTFVDGASGMGTGKLFNRILFGAPAYYVKGAGEDTTIECEFSVN